MEARGEQTVCDDCYMPWIWPENEAPIRAWLSIRTQWVYAGMGQRVGLSYAGVEADLRLCGFDVAAVWPDLKVMESETLNIDALKRKHASHEHRRPSR